MMRFRWLVIVPVLLLAVRPSRALTDEEIFRDFRFNLINPGARSLALGGAFISIADDATAAVANPAGLVLLRRPEYFGELRLVDNGARSTTQNETLPTGVQTVVATGTTPDDFVSPSFLSVVIPLKQRWVLGVSRQEVLRTQSTTLNAFSFTFPASPGIFLMQGAGSIRVTALNYNLSAGYRLSDKVFLGGSVAYSTIDVESDVLNTVVDTEGNVAGREILEPTLDLATSIRDTDDTIAFNVGAIWRPMESDRFTLGAVYRKAPKFAVDEVIAPATPDANGDGYPDGGIDIFDKRALFGCAATAACVFSNAFNLPDSYGVGFGWQINDTLTLSEDIERIEYSDLTDGYIAGVNALTSADASFRVDDAWEARLGVEYLVLRWKVPFAVRGGFYTEHDSTIRATSTGTSSFATPAAFPGRNGHIHGTMGAGALFGDGRFKLDFAANIAQPANEYVLSFIFRGK